MERKIHKNIFFIAVLAILTTLLVVMGVFYHRFQQQISQDLRTFGTIILKTEGWQEASDLADSEKIRITLIDQDGKVLSDNVADPSSMENHNNRPEVIQARKDGFAETTRKSSTFSEVSTYYYAMRLDDGKVLRVSREASSLSAIFFDTLPLILLLSGGILLLALWISRILTRSIMLPIHDMANHMDELDHVQVYPELVPVVKTIQNQHENMIRQSKMRQDFTANVTHELKTPLTSISGYSELIETGMANPEDVSHFAHEIHKSSDRLLTTINDIIRLSELDSEIDEMQESVDLYEVAKDCLESLNVNAQKYEVNLMLEGQSETVMAARERMVELIYNLVDNAIRYNKKNGYVKVKIDHDSKGVYLSVEDNGIGIPKRYHERIFERFYRVDKSRSKATGGTGLGLAIVKHIVLNHHATLSIESEEGKGTNITVHFPNEMSATTCIK